MDYTSERKRKADDQMTKVAHRFKNDVAKDEGDYGNVPAEYAKAAPGATYEEEDDIMKENIETLLQNVLVEAEAWTKDASKHTNSWTAAPGFTPCPQCHGVGSLRGKKDVAPCPSCQGGGRVKKTNEGFNDDVPGKLKAKKALHSADQDIHCAVCGNKHPTKDHPQSIHTANALSGENNIHEDSSKNVLGKMKVTHVPSGRSRMADITSDHLHSIAHQDRFHTLPKQFGGKSQSTFPKPQDYVDHMNRVAKAQKGNGGHDWHHELVEAAMAMSTPSKFTHKIHVGNNAASVGRMLRNHFPQTRISSPHLYVDTNHPAEHVNQALGKIHAVSLHSNASAPKVMHTYGESEETSGWNRLKQVRNEDESKDIQKRNKLEKCEACGEMHAHDVPCPDKTLLSDTDDASSDDNYHNEEFSLAEAMKEPEMMDMAKQHGFSHSGSQFRSGNYGPNSVKDTTMTHPSGHSLKITSFYHSPSDINHHLAGQGTWSMEHNGSSVASGHDPSHLKHELGKVSGLREGKSHNKFKKWTSNQMTISTTPEDIKRRSKMVVGMPPAKRIIKSKKDKSPRYKEDFNESTEGAWREDHHQVLAKHGYQHKNTDPEHYSTYTHPNGSHVEVSQNTGKWQHKGPNKKLVGTSGESAHSLDSHLKDVERRKRSTSNAKAKHQAMTDLGLKRVKGALGGTYYEGVAATIKQTVMEENTAQKIRLHKEKRPELYCKNCLWKTGGGQCPRHGGPPAKSSSANHAMLKAEKK